MAPEAIDWLAAMRAMLPLGQRRQLMVLPTNVWSPRPELGEYWPAGQSSQVVAPTPEYVPGALQQGKHQNEMQRSVGD